MIEVIQQETREFGVLLFDVAVSRIGTLDRSRSIPADSARHRGRHGVYGTRDTAAKLVFSSCAKAVDCLLSLAPACEVTLSI